VKKTNFPTPQDAEAAFYQALERADLEGMMEVWSEDDEVVCVHPGGPRLAGYDQVRASWARMFGGAQKLSVYVSGHVYLQSGMLSVHSVFENIAPTREGEADRESAAPRTPVVATNVYLRADAGWRMILHHASMVPSEPARAAASATLH